MSCISIVIPVFNEEQNLETLVSRLRDVLTTLNFDDHEILFIEDGSCDRSPEILEGMHRRDPKIGSIFLSRNFGHQAALQAGLDESRGDAVVLMDADLQDPPEVIRDFGRLWRASFEVVCGVREKRKENVFKRMAYRTFYRTMRWIANIDVPIDAGDFCLLDRRVVKALTSLRERNRFLRGLRSWVGFRQAGVPYVRHAREAGTPKYNLSRLVGLAISGYIGFSALPLRLASWIGLASAFFGPVMACWAMLSKITGRPTPWGWASTISVVLFMGGMQLLVLGILGEYISRMYDEARRRPLYVVSHRLDSNMSHVSASG